MDGSCRAARTLPGLTFTCLAAAVLPARDFSWAKEGEKNKIVNRLSRGDELVLTPRFSPASQDVTYMAFGRGDPSVYLMNIENGQREAVGNFPGMTFSPRFSPDGTKVVFEALGNLWIRDLPAGTPSEVLTRRPDVRQAEQSLQAANANVGATRALYYPNISLTGALGTTSTAFSSWVTASTPIAIFFSAASVLSPRRTAIPARASAASPRRRCASARP